jgi:hypothetical protein
MKAWVKALAVKCCDVGIKLNYLARLKTLLFQPSEISTDKIISKRLLEVLFALSRWE